MKIFDMHADIGTNLLQRKKQGKSDVFKNVHYPELRKGNVRGVFTACFFDGSEDYETMQEMVYNCNEELNSNDVAIITGPKDLKSDKLLTLISLEGMCGVRDNVAEKLEWFYKHNVRVASLCWNDENALASGWPNNPLHGLSEEGFKAIRKMNELKMIIDVSHINELGFWQIINASKRPVIATHSNSRTICNHQRNLTDQQCKAIALKGGLIGLNSASHFIDEKREKQTALGLASHARYMADLVGVEHIACGFDYMNFLDGFSSDDNALDLNSAADSQNIVEALRAYDFSEEEIRKICFENVYAFLEREL
ncbi:MAG: membrane dipeptidase [Erysipelotrichaceae bacterium]|nr:membrane dipeptidase [Erysipelotrichaceae bacterium]